MSEEKEITIRDLIDNQRFNNPRTDMELILRAYEFAAANHGVANTQEVGFQYRGNGLSISHDLTCIEEKIEAVRFSMKWRFDFVSKQHPGNKEDKHLIELIKRDAPTSGNHDIDDMVEFDIRKHFWTRSWFWFWHRQKHGISMKRYLCCLLRTIKYRAWR